MQTKKSKAKNAVPAEELVINQTNGNLEIAEGDKGVQMNKEGKAIDNAKRMRHAIVTSSVNKLEDIIKVAMGDKGEQMEKENGMQEELVGIEVDGGSGFAEPDNKRKQSGGESRKGLSEAEERSAGDSRGCVEKKIVGYEAERQEMKELGDMLRNAKRYLKLGVRIPRGVVLYGEPGVGKSVMANSIAKGKNPINVVRLNAAVCCEDDSVKHVQAAFTKAKEMMPCVLILDELDKIAGTSKNFFMADNDDVKKVLLQELDKLQSKDEVLVVATCNDCECLGDALLRAGRFDRQIEIGLPNDDNRRKILEYYLSLVKIKKNLDIKYVNRMMQGCSCADIECVVNESAIHCLMNKGKAITEEDVRYAITKSILKGLPSQNEEMDKEKLKRVAVHEAGHALAAFLLYPENVLGASIINQGKSNGHVEFAAGSEEVMSSKSNLESYIDVALAGRMAEIEYFNEMYSGSGDDFNKALNMLEVGLTKEGYYGTEYLICSHRMGPFGDSSTTEAKKLSIEQKSAQILNQSERRVREIISDNMDILEMLVKELMEHQYIDKDKIAEIVTGKGVRAVG